MKITASIVDEIEGETLKKKFFFQQLNIIAHLKMNKIHLFTGVFKMAIRKRAQIIVIGS